jgi:tellurite resistance protein
MGDPPVVELPAATPVVLEAAVAAVLTGAAESAALPAASRLRAGAEAAAAARSDGEAARFQAMLELAYLAASADGLDAREREALARLIELATGAAVDRATLHTHFADLDAAVAMLGRRERLARAAAELGDDSATEALGFAALVAMADGRLHAPELAVLVELGGCLGQSPAQVRAVVDLVAASVEKKLR